MTATPTRGARASTPRDDSAKPVRTPAQWYCAIVGAVLTLVGLLGFTADATFDTESSDTTPGGFQGNGFLGFEVNGWHNVVHLVSGLALLALYRRRGSARAGAIAFGLTYALVSVIGIIDGDNVLGLIPVNAADNVLHPLLALLGLFTGLASRGDGRERDRPRAGPRPRAAGPAVDERSVMGAGRRRGRRRG